MKRRTKIKLIRMLLLTSATTFICRAPLLGETFPAATAIITYLTSEKPGYIFLILPIATGILPYLREDADPWGSLISTAICGIVFALVRKTEINMTVWQKAAVAVSINITVNCIYKLLTMRTYQLTVMHLTAENLLITVMIFMTQNMYNCFKNREYETQIALMTFSSASLLILCGIGLQSMLWPATVFISLWAATSLSADKAVQATLAAGVTAALAGQAEWGFLITLIISICVISLCKTDAILLKNVLFVLAAFVMQTVENGIVLGIDNYILFTGWGAFVLCSLKYEKQLTAIIRRFAGDRPCTKNEAIVHKIKSYAESVGELADFYGTYLDSRSALAYQLCVTKQILEHIVYEMKARKEVLGHIALDIAVSQCAAVGNINGDCCGWDDIGDNRVAMIISDGMGKGKKAAAESLLVVKTMLTLLKCGANTEHTLKMINTIMMIKDDSDSFATVDIAIIDKRSAKARLYKIGAAPTLIKRKEHVEEVGLSAIPLGIVNGIKIQYVEIKLHPGDLIVMMSDGISDGPDGRGALDEVKETIQQIKDEDTRKFCDIILNRSADSYIGKERDDLTVLVARIE